MFLENIGWIVLYLYTVVGPGFTFAHLSWDLHSLDAPNREDESVFTGWVRLFIFPGSNLLEVLSEVFHKDYIQAKLGFARYFEEERHYLWFASFLWPIKLVWSLIGTIVLFLTKLILLIGVAGVDFISDTKSAIIDRVHRAKKRWVK